MRAAHRRRLDLLERRECRQRVQRHDDVVNLRKKSANLDLARLRAAPTRSGPAEGAGWVKRRSWIMDL